MNTPAGGPPQAPTALLALDWGTSSLRAWRLSASGAVLEQRQRPWGILHLPEGGFLAAFAAITEGWRSSSGNAIPAIACGMVGSRQGWREVEYLALPLDLGRLAASLAPVPEAGSLHLVPGLLDETRPGRPDVMRGEETEAVGALERLDNAPDEVMLVMPGTHCKWVRLSRGVIASFTTYMTGELFAVLMQHSILGRTAAPAGTLPDTDPSRRTAFRDGVIAASADGLAARLFSTRALTLTGHLDAALVPDYLSGLLIGEELVRALADARAAAGEPGRIVLVGDPAITRRYADAFAVLGEAVPTELAAASVRGLYRIAAAAGLATAQPGDAAC